MQKKEKGGSKRQAVVEYEIKYTASTDFLCFA